MAGKIEWTEAMDNRLTALRANGKSWAQCAIALGVSRTAASDRGSKLHLPRMTQAEMNRRAGYVEGGRRRSLQVRRAHAGHRPLPVGEGLKFLG